MNTLKVIDNIKKIATTKDTIRVLQIDGGGCKGVIPANLLKYIELKLEKPISQIFDLIVGSSVGSIIGGIMASGKLPAPTLYDLFKAALPIVFKKRIIRNYLTDPRYDRQPLVDIIVKNVGAIKMKDCQTNFMSTAVNVCDTQTHFFKSWEDKDGDMLLLNAINYSYAAPFYFGTMIDTENKAVWMDGGTGDDNCPLIETVIECLRQGWIQNKKVHVLSLGCGAVDLTTSFEKARGLDVFGQIWFYMKPDQGGLAKEQSTRSNVSIANALASTMNTFTFNRVDALIDKKYDILDGAQYFYVYEELSKTMVPQIDLSKLQG
jgi:uncharacterized protein